jgi:hypothetical protein
MMTRIVQRVVLAALLLMALWITPATAAVFQAESNKTVFVHGESLEPQTFTVKSGTISCTNATFAESEEYGTGHIEEFGSVTLVPSYSGCTILGGIPIKVNVNKCGFTVSPEMAQTFMVGTAGGSCEKNGVVLQAEGLCQWAFPKQVVGPTKFKNSEKVEGTVETEIEGTSTLTYIQSGACSGGVFNNGSIAGNVLLRAVDGEEETVSLSVK